MHFPCSAGGNGHVRTFWSVGEHCICCAKEALARGLGARLALACLLHDASECYLSDIPRPFKESLPAYQKLEDHLLDLVYERFLGSTLTEEEQEELKKIDDDLLWYDLEGSAAGASAPAGAADSHRPRLCRAAFFAGGGGVPDAVCKAV